MRLKDKVAVVFGGASGIGAKTAEMIRAEGGKIVVVDRKENKIVEADGNAIADVCDTAAVAAAFDAAEELGPVGVVVNAAGISAPAASIMDFDPDAWLRTLDVNARGSMIVGAEAQRRMRKSGGGAIVFVASNVARRGLPNRSDYVASKWALMGLVQTLALEAVDDGIRVNSVLPGPVDTPLLWQVVDDHARVENKTREDVAEEWRLGAPMKRFIEPEEVAKVIMFLASEDSSAMTGQGLNVTGGHIMT